MAGFDLLLLGKRAEDIKAASNEICANLISNGFTYNECFMVLLKVADQIKNTIPTKNHHKELTHEEQIPDC